jgi:4'-phosphopantetheinyl transferase
MSLLRIPSTDDVMIFFSRLDRDPAQLASESSELSPSELKRAERLPAGLARDRFMAGRLFLRNTIAPLLDQRARDISLEAGKWGKPRLSSYTYSCDLRFNISHSADLAILAVCSGFEAGVDLEKIDTGIPCLNLARLFFSAREFRELLTLPEEDQRDAFFRCWTRKEAYLKGCGRGFSLPADSFDVSLLPGSPPLILDHRTIPDHKESWVISDIAAPQGYCAAIAVEARTPVIRYMNQ